MTCQLCTEQPVSPYIYMMRDGGGGDDEVEDVGWNSPEDAPVGLERGEAIRGGPDPEAELSTDGECVRLPRGAPEPKTPAPDVVARHNLTHLPYAQWCPHCVAARRANNPHFRREESFRRLIPLLVFDYCFVRNTQDEDLLTLSVGRLYPTKKMFTCPVNMKGRDPVAANLLADFIKANGLTKFVYKCDQERALDALSQSAIEKTIMTQIIEEAAQRSGRSAAPADESDARIAVPENSPVGESQSNGKAERAVQTMEDQIRTIKLALESRIGARIPCNHPVMHWIVLHCADILNKFTVNRATGLSPYEETHGQRPPERRVELGERVFYYTPKKGRKKLDPRWKLGVYLGHCEGTSEAYVGVPNGNVRRTRTVLRVVAESRWSKELIQRILGTPHELTPVPDDELDSDEIEADPAPHEPNEEAPPPPSADDAAESRAAARRRLRITMKDLGRYGYTGGCPRCADLEFGNVKTKKLHSEECRDRIYKEYEKSKHEKYTKVRAEIERARAENAPMPNFVDLDAADYEQWLSREIAREQTAPTPPPTPRAPDPPVESAEDDAASAPPEAKRARIDEPASAESAPGQPDVREDADNRDWRYPPDDYRHYRWMAGGDGDRDAPPSEPEAKRARTVALLCHSLVDAGVNELDAGKYAMAMMGSADEATFIEMYGCGSIINEANGPRRNLGLRGLSAFDLRTMKPDGGNWDFRLKSDRHLALKMVEDMNPDFVIGSPPCTAWCVCVWNQHLNFKRMDPKRVKEMMDEGRVHLNFVARLYRRQIANGKVFLHEHPALALSWNEKCITDLLARSDVQLVKADQCQYGLTTPSRDGKRLPAMKPTNFLTNAPQLAALLQKRCDHSHRHQALEGNRCADAAFYPLDLVRTILRGM